jgi:hypothetical protein
MSCLWKHHEEGGCPTCAAIMGHKKKLLAAMVFFGLMAIFNAMIAGFIHLVLHAIEVKKEE